MNGERALPALAVCAYLAHAAMTLSHLDTLPSVTFTEPGPLFAQALVLARLLAIAGLGLIAATAAIQLKRSDLRRSVVSLLLLVPALVVLLWGPMAMPVGYAEAWLRTEWERTDFVQTLVVDGLLCAALLIRVLRPGTVSRGQRARTTHLAG